MYQVKEGYGRAGWKWKIRQKKRMATGGEWAKSIFERTRSTLRLTRKNQCWLLRFICFQSETLFTCGIFIFLKIICLFYKVDVDGVASAAGASFTFCDLATAFCALLKLINPSVARFRISSSTERFTFFDTICFNFCCSVCVAFFCWIGASGKKRID